MESYPLDMLAKEPSLELETRLVRSELAEATAFSLATKGSDFSVCSYAR